MSYFFWNYWPVRSQRTPNIAGYFQYYWLPSEFDSAKKHNRVLEPGQISPERKELKALSYYLASIALEGATQTTREKITHPSYSAMNPVRYHCPGKTQPLVHSGWYIHLESIQPLSRWLKSCSTRWNPCLAPLLG